MLPSADFEDGLKIYNNSMLCNHVGQLPALRLLSLNLMINIYLHTLSKTLLHAVEIIPTRSKN